MFDLAIPKGWRLVKLSDLGEVNRGRSRHRPRDAEHLYGGPYPFVQTGDVKASQGRITSFSQTYSEAGLNQSRLWPKDTMCITIAANIAETGILQFPACFPDSVIGFIPDKSQCNVYFVEYVFRLLRKSIQAQATGSVQDNINLQTLERLYFPLPELKQQNSLADVLCSFDDKIELNRQTNQTLEQIAQAIFKSWFVDFEPTRAKIIAKEQGANLATQELAAQAIICGAITLEQLAEVEQNLETTLQQAIDEKLNQHNQTNPTALNAQQLKTTAALFPNELAESELGDVPEGWSWSEIGREVTVVGGGTPSTKNEEYWDGGSISWTTPRDMSNLTDKILLETSRKITPSGLAKISSGLLPVNTVLMSSRAPVGYLAITKIPVAINQGYIAMKCNDILTPEYVVQWAEMSMDEIKQRASGTTFAEINRTNFRLIPVLVPHAEVITQFSKIVSALYENITSNLKETKTLESIRDALLPKLLSGEITLTEEVKRS